MMLNMVAKIWWRWLWQSWIYGYFDSDKAGSANIGYEDSGSDDAGYIEMLALLISVLMMMDLKISG